MDRKTEQHLMPISFEEKSTKNYNIYPSFPIKEGEINYGFDSLARTISEHKMICIDGYVGVNWEGFIEHLLKALSALDHHYELIDIKEFYKPKSDIEELVTPYLGNEDPVFGKLYQGELIDFFDSEKLKTLSPQNPTILFGTGAALSNVKAKLIYIDVPKNEIQYRSRAGNVHCLGMDHPIPPKKQYKRMFFVDWPILNKHKKSLVNRINYMVDAQFMETITWCTGETLLAALKGLSKNAFRVRPWFEPGVWGGDWIKRNIEGLNKEVVNYAWSFECIVPENGIVISDKGWRLELSFDMLMYYNSSAVLGTASEIFETDFPIRFDFLDTFNGSNLSLQCHPSPAFIKKQFNEKFTQDETYYMLDVAPGAEVYLGFQEDIDKEEFHRELMKSEGGGTLVSVEKFVQKHQAKKHDLFLIPHGTIHCSGKNAMVLEISSTPYIYTFKMYDWMRTDLDGKPRPLNIERAMENLNFDCKGKRVKEAYISKEEVISEEKDSKIIKLPTHKDHFYEVFRNEFLHQISIDQYNQCHILNLVEGEQIKVITNGRELLINYAETFIIPASTGSYDLVNLGNTKAKVIRANVKQNLKKHEI